ncbi:Biofilm and cell wall regulator 1 [Chaetomidium leptoderma]|uniref:Biofilm and cell wall regulator 1 n=1 Tax=Chaetomidium leptoderma TaxID=669021 RepID=A0AAN6VDZ5_9PEZI|nr:Biofilm and cell wall regulator 1 [Chaetomidium leptoderma]
MAAAFRPVNNPLSAAEPPRDEISSSPMTPRPTTAPTQSTRPLDEAATPTRASFGTGALSSQKPLPTSPFPESVQIPELAATTPKREHSQHSRRSKESDDVDMDDSDGEGHEGDDGAGSDDESVNGDGTKNKKKKSQRFYCTEYPPCNLSFTRSEHLARHIRKHTGERPFQCHCSRRFSRLDNLRQHAQTVHVNEDIPMDSLAATGTRFQRQIRTDRVRQPGRARASTASSVGPAGRGHSKSLSTSSITSVGSIASSYNVSDARRRPPPLVMADPRSRMSVESYRGPDGQYYRPPSPGDFSTPTSATFSTGQSSPRWGPVMSPGSSHSRSHSMYAGARTPGRRLSVPSGGNPFQSPHGPGVRGPAFGTPTLNSSNAGAFSPSQSSLLLSPTTPTSTWSRRDSMSSTLDEAWRRRTWHPDTRDYNGGPSRLSQVITPSQFPPDTVTLPAPNTATQQSQSMRLPGIESFDEMTRLAPPPRNPSPMMIDSEVPRPPAQLQSSELGPDDQRGQAVQWDQNLHRLTRLDINTPPRDSAGSWANEANQALLVRAEQTRVRFEPVPTAPPPMASANAPGILGPRHQHTVSAPAFNTPRESRRHGWYNGPVTAHPTSETIHEGRPHVERMVHPNIGAFQGFPAREQQPVIHQQQLGSPMERMERVDRLERMERIPERPPNHGGNPESMKRLEALVAVATGQGPVATAY